jgi:3D (Asp-Asp-Asp) domain-containing protein
MWVLSILVAMTAIVGLWLAADVRASASAFTFGTDKRLLAEGPELKAELEQRLNNAQVAKAERLAEEKRQAEEEARCLEAERLAAEAKKQEARRLAAVPRSDSNQRGHASGVSKTATYYTPDPRENGGWGVTATGENLQDLVNSGSRVVASNDYPLGTQLKINGQWYRVADRMGQGGKVDFLVGTHAEARAGGRHQVVIEEVR